MSYEPKRYQYRDEGEEDFRDYEKVKPSSFRDYIASLAKGTKVSPQQTPAQQVNEPTFAKRAEEKPVSTFRDYIAKLPQKEPSTAQGIEEPNLYSKYVERPAQIVGGGAAAGVRAAPRTTYDVAKFLLGLGPGSGVLGGKLLEGLEQLEKNAPEQFKNLLANLFPSYEEVRERQQLEGAPKPEGAIENFLEKAGRFAGESVIPLARGGNRLRQAGGIAGAAAGAQAGEELDLPPLYQAALAIGGGALGHGISGRPQSSIARASKQRITPEVEEYIRASRELGIDPLATGMNPTQLQKVAQKLSTHGFNSHEIAEEAYRHRSGQVSRAFEEALDAAGENLFTEPYIAGTESREALRQAERQVERTKSQLYRDIDRTLPPEARVHAQPVADRIDAARDAIEQSIAQAPAEGRTRRYLENARENLTNLTQNRGPYPLMDVRELDATRRSLGDVINWERPGGVDKLLIPLYNEIESTLNRYGQTNPAYRQARNAANQYFRDNVVQIRQNLLQSVIHGERPEAVLNLMGDVNGIRQVGQALSHLPDGERVFNALKRFKLRSLIGDKIINPETGLMKLNPTGHGVHNFLSKKTDFYPVLRELAGEEGIRRLQSLEHAGRGLSKGFNTLFNPSKSADTLIAIQSILGPAENVVKGIGKLPKAEGLSYIAKGAAQLLMPEVVARIMLDPNFANQILEASRAGASGNAVRFNRLISTIDSTLKKDEKEKK